MWSTAFTRQVVQTRRALIDRFQNEANVDTRHVRTLSTPGSGPLLNRRLMWLPKRKRKLWAYFFKEPFGENRWGCWFGTDIGEAGQVLHPSIEINLTIDPGNRRSAGRSLVDESGRLGLGHKGGLGGGRGGQMSMIEFAKRVRGFVQEPVLFPDGREHAIFVIGAIEDADLLDRLADYVHECQRLRDFAKARSRKGTESSRSGIGDEGPSGFNPENELPGTGSGGSRDPREIQRLHGKVVNKLAVIIGKRALNESHLEMRPDLYIWNSRQRRIEMLFEVKAHSSSQSWFTAIGQLLVYGAGQKRPPRRILVCPAPLKGTGFADALRDLNIELLIFRRDGRGHVEFPDLQRLLAHLV